MFSVLSELNRHIKQFHKNHGSFVCETCDKKFNRKQTLQRHQKTHDKNRPKPFKCQRCSYACDTTGNYRQHQRFHETQDKKLSAMKNPIKCQKCSTLCRNKIALNAHMRGVHKEVQYQYDLCGKYIKFKSSMTYHIRTKTCQN